MCNVDAIGVCIGRLYLCLFFSIQFFTFLSSFNDSATDMLMAGLYNYVMY